MTAPSRLPDEYLLGFARALRAAGVPVTQDRAQTYLDAVSAVGLADRHATYAAGRATLCGTPDDLARHDQIFQSWFGDDLPSPQKTTRSQASAPTLLPESDGDGSGDEGDDAVPLRARASTAEVLRHRDIADLNAVERARMNQLIGRLSVRHPARRTPRQRAFRRGRVDAPRTLRASLSRLGEPAEIRWRRRSTRPRRVVVLLDVSGSMTSYAEVLLRVGHRAIVASGGPVEVFTLGTRLTHVTRALQHRDPDRALAAAGDVVPDWSGGTRLGDGLQAFMRRHAGLARGAVVVIASDGWERGDATLLGDQVARISRLAHRVIWLNPHRGKVGYEPLQRGIRAALPHVDRFVAGHSLATYEALLTEVGADA